MAKIRVFELARDLNMTFSAKLSWDESFSPIQDKEFVKEQTGLSIVTRDEYYQEHGMDYMREACYQLWESPQINWDGTVSACCRDYDNMMIVGDLRRNTLAEIWAGSEIEGWRERIRNGDYSHPLCKDCYKYIEMEGE